MSVRLGDLCPGEHRPPRRGYVPAGAKQAAHKHISPVLVGVAYFCGKVLIFVHHDRRGDLDWLERAVVQVALQLRKRCYGFGVADTECNSPASHRKGLRQAVELDRDVLGSLRLQDRRRLVAVEADIGIGEVVHEQDLALTGEIHDALHELQIHTCRGRVVRKREHDDPRTGPRVLEAFHQSVKERVPGVQGHLSNVRPRKQRTEDVDRIRRRRHHARVTGRQQRPHEVRETLLGADGVDDLGVAVKFHSPLSAVKLRERDAELGNPAACRVPVVARVERSFGQLLHGSLRRSNIRIAEAEIDDVGPCAASLDLQRIDDREDVWRQTPMRRNSTASIPVRRWSSTGQRPGTRRARRRPLRDGQRSRPMPCGRSDVLRGA